jgi:23S rRNA (pseudouridine1915-N3)-methyltransferase
MRARLIAVGERMPAWIAAGFAEYARRLSRELPLELVEIPPGGRARNRDPQRARSAEGDAILAAVPRGARLVALDARGDAWSSEELARQLAHWRESGSDIALAIGGADGHAPALIAAAAQRWSLGAATFPHMLVRVLVAEQLYRAATQLAGHPYHRA